MNTENQTTESVQVHTPSPEIKKIILPRYVRVDFLETIRRIRIAQRGETVFNGVRKATIELSQGGVGEKPDEFFRERGELAIGRILPNDQSWTDYVTQVLGIEEDSGMKKISAAIRRAENDRGSRTALPRILESLTHLDDDRVPLEMVATYGIRALHYIHSGEIKRRVSQRGDGTLLTIFDEMCSADVKGAVPFKNERAVKSTRDLLQQSMDRQHNSIFELGRIKDCIMASEKVTDAKLIIRNLIYALYMSEVRYFEAVDLCASAKRFPISFMQWKRGENGKLVKGEKNRLIPGEVVKVNAVFFETPNLAVTRASHEAKDVGIVVVQHPKRGNVGIWVSQELPEAINREVELVTLWRMIQSLELIADGMKPSQVPWMDLKDPYPTHEAVTFRWKFNRKYRNFMNGLKQDDVPQTRIRPEQFLLALEHAFDPRLIGVWQRRHGIGVVRKSSRPAAKGVSRAGENSMEAALEAAEAESSNTATEQSAEPASA